MVAMLIVLPVSAATFVWDHGSGTVNWSDEANWDPDGVPVSDASTVVQLYGSGLTANQDIESQFLLNRLEIYTSPASSESALNVSGNQLKFVGADARIYSNRRATETVSNNIQLDAGTVLTAEVTTYAVQLTGVITGEGSITKLNHAGGLTLTNSANTFSGGIVYNGKSGSESWNHLIVTASGAMGTGLVQLNGGATGIWNGTGGHQPGGLIFRNTTTQMNNISLGAHSPIFSGLPASSADAASNVTLAGSITGNEYDLYLRGPGKGMISGDITSTDGGLVKMDANTWTLDGNNNYQGATTIRKTPVAATGTNVAYSTLNVTGSITGTSNVHVDKEGARLSGTGIITTAITGKVLIDSGGILAPGDVLLNGTGNLTIVSDLEFNAGALWELNVDGDFSSSLTLQGDFESSLSNITLTAGATMNPLMDNAYWLLNNDGTDSLTGMFANLINGPLPGGQYADATGYFDLGNGQFFAAYIGADYQSGSNFGGNDIVLYAVPEPQRAFLMMLGLTFWFFTGSRSRKA